MKTLASTAPVRPARASRRSTSESLFRYILNMAVSGDSNALREFGFLPEDIPQVMSLSVREALYMEEHLALYMQVIVDREIFWQVMAMARAHSQSETLEEDLIRHGAPASLMRELCGLSAADTAQKRTMYQVY